jgi:peptidoglycan/xylan/chitin deacetylase (PgdA/CDA1 family)
VISRNSSVAHRVTIVFYGAFMMSALLGFAAVNLRAGPRPAGAVAAVAPATLTGPSQSASPLPSLRAATTSAPAFIGTPEPSETAAPSRTPMPTFAPSLTPTALPSLTPSPMPTALPSLTPSAAPTALPSLTPTAPSAVANTATPGPTPGPGAGNRKICVPILTYHHIGLLPAGADRLRKGLTTSPRRFEQHLAYFAENGIVPITLDDLLYALAQGAPLPEKRVILTIDDGYDDVYEYAFPLLAKYGFTATLFIPTGFIDNGMPGYMTWPEIEEMARAGHDIQPHTKDHIDLRRHRRATLVYQILGSKQTVEAHTGRIARWFSYPGGAYDDNAIAMLKEMNFWGAVSTDAGVVQSLEDIYVLKRLRVSESIDIESMMVYMRFCGFEEA